MSTESEAKPAESQQPQTENQGGQQNTGEISSLANYMARRRSSSEAGQATQTSGEGSPSTAATEPQQSEERSQYIPRERFDQVLAERNQLREQAQPQQPQQTPPQPQPPQPFPQQPQGPQLNTGMQPGQQFQPQQNVSPTGMVGQQQQPNAPQMPDFSDPQVRKEWNNRLNKEGVGALQELISTAIRAEGTPLLEQYVQQVRSQLTPLQQNFVQQQLSSYSQQRTQQDPSFQQIAPTFQQLVSQAAQRGYSLDPQTLQAIEGIARGQAGLFNQPVQQPQQPPFSEQPGGTGSLGQKSEPQLNGQQRMMADRFGMSHEEYAQTYGSL